jgi:hypothetical protein
VTVFNGAVLDAERPANDSASAELSCTISKPSALRESDRARRWRGGAAGEGLDDARGCRTLAPFIDGHASTLDGVAAVFGELQDRVAGDAALEDAGSEDGVRSVPSFFTSTMFMPPVFEKSPPPRSRGKDLVAAMLIRLGRAMSDEEA